jgi:hypothetical protein
MRKRIDSAPNHWGWGWAPGFQQTAEFTILEAYFCAAYPTMFQPAGGNISKRIREIMHPGCHLADRHQEGWLITMFNRSTTEIPL